MPERQSSDPPKEPANTRSVKTKHELEREKLEIELEKLEIERKTYKTRMDLETRKLESDVKDWYYRVVTAIATVAIGLSTFFLGQHFQAKSDTAKRQLEILEDQNAKFSQVLIALGNSDPSQRATAADALVPYLTDLGPKASANREESEAAQTRAATAIASLADRLITDADLGNKEHYSRALTLSGQSSLVTSLKEVVRVNRISSLQFGRAAGAWLATRLQNPELQLQTDCNSLSNSDEPKLRLAQEEQRKHLEELQNLVLRAVMPFESVYQVGGTAVPRFNPLPLLTTPGVQSTYQLQCRYTLQGVMEPQIHSRDKREKVEAEIQASHDTEEAVLLASQNIAATSLTLADLLRRMKGHLQGAQLERVAIVNVSLDGMDLSGASLREAFFDGTGIQFLCIQCDLSYADFRYFRLAQGGVLKLSNVDGMKLEYDTSYGINMEGVNWWRAISVDPNNKTKQAPMNLEGQYPKAATQQMRSKLKLSD
jgi:hypothetical protein